MKFRQIIELTHLRGDFVALDEDGELYLVEVDTDEYRAVATKFRVDLGDRDPFQEEDPKDEG